MSNWMVYSVPFHNQALKRTGRACADVRLCIFSRPEIGKCIRSLHREQSVSIDSPDVGNGSVNRKSDIESNLNDYKIKSRK